MSVIRKNSGALTYSITYVQDSSESAEGDLLETLEDCSKESYSSQV